MQQEVQTGVGKEIPVCTGMLPATVPVSHDKLTVPFLDWNSLAPYPMLMKLFARVSARVMVGPELAGDEWQRISLQYISTILEAQMAVRLRFHPWFYPFAKYIAPEINKLAKIRREAADFVQPVVDARYAIMAEKAGSGTHERPEDAIQWLMDEHAARGKRISADELVQNVFITMVASIHSTAMVALSILFDLLDHPDSLRDIREEIARVKAKLAQSHASGAWTRQGLAELRVLDSFMRETMRVHSFTQGTFISCLSLDRFRPSTLLPECAQAKI